MQNDDTPPPDKPGLRRWAKRRRAPVDWDALSAVLTPRLRALPELTAARNVLLYLGTSDEVRVEALLEETEAAGRRWYAPHCAPGRRLAVHRYAPKSTPLRRGPFGIREPDPAQVEEADPIALDLVVVPALLLSERGERLGYGGGYYDRLLPRLAPACRTVGVLPEALILPALPQDPWDRRLDIIVTEARVLRPE